MNQPLKLEDFVWATGVFCQLNRIPHNAAMLIKQYPPPYDVLTTVIKFGVKFLIITFTQSAYGVLLALRRMGNIN